MKFGQLKIIARETFSYKNHAEIGAGRLVLDLFFFFKKSFILGKSKTQKKYILMVLNLAYNKSKLYKTLGYCSRDRLNFDFLEKGLGRVSPPHFVYDFSRIGLY